MKPGLVAVMLSAGSKLHRQRPRPQLSMQRKATSKYVYHSDGCLIRLTLIQSGDVVLVCDAGGGTTVRSPLSIYHAIADKRIIGRQHPKSDSFWTGPNTNKSPHVGRRQVNPTYLVPQNAH